LQTSSHMTQLFSLMKSVISEVFDIAFAWVIFQYQV
jgi:hypothetical protein